MTSCATDPAPKTLDSNVAAPVVAPTVTADACAWLKMFTLDPGYAVRWTRGEKEQAVSLNRNIQKYCRNPTNGVPAK